MPSLRFSIFLVIIQLAGVALAAQLPPNMKCSEEEIQGKVRDPKHMQCVQKYFDFKTVPLEYQKAREDTSNNKSLAEFFASMCPKILEAVTCLDGLIDDIGLCFDGPAERYAFKSVKGMANSLIEYLCFDGGKRMLELYAQRGDECLSKNKNQIQDCVSTKEVKKMFKMDEIEQGSIPDLKKVTIEDAVKQCKGISTVSECFLSIVKHKCSDYSHTFFDGLIMAVMQESPCWNTLAKLEKIEPQHYILAGLVPKHVLSSEKKCPSGELTMDLSVKAISDASVCWNRNLDLTVLADLGKDALMKGTFAKFMADACPRFVNVTTCVGQYLDSFKPCVSDQDASTLNATKNLVTELVRFACNNSGEPVLRFINGNGMECIGKQGDTIETCMKDANVKYFNDDQVFDGDLSSLLLQNTWTPQYYNVDECRTVIAFDICVGKAMNTCENKDPANVVHDLLQSMSKQTPCRDVKQAASASSGFFLCASPFLFPPLLLLTKFAGF